MTQQAPYYIVPLFGDRKFYFNDKNKALAFLEFIPGDAALLEGNNPKPLEVKNILNTWREMVDFIRFLVLWNEEDGEVFQPLTDHMWRHYSKLISMLRKGNGVFLQGPGGVGKTTMMQVINILTTSQHLKQVQTFRMFEVNKLQQDFQAKNYECFNDLLYTAHDIKPVLLDGLEPDPDKVTFNHFGKKVNILSHAIDMLYQDAKNKKRIVHVTTNYSFADILINLGDETFTKLTEMMELYIITGPQANQEVMANPELNQ